MGRYSCDCGENSVCQCSLDWFRDEIDSINNAMEALREYIQVQDKLIGKLMEQVKELEESIEQTDHWVDTVNEQVQKLSIP